MSFDRRKNDGTEKVGPFFYAFAIGIFAVIALTTFIVCLWTGFTEQRIALMFLNAWFTLFTMDLVTVRFSRKGERAPWHDWAAFRRNEEDIDSNISSKEKA